MDESSHEALEKLRSIHASLVLRSQIQGQLVAFEHELRSNNRFFPRTHILSWVDAIAPMVQRTLTPGTTLYRSRIIAKAEEDTFLAPIYSALGVFAKDSAGNFSQIRFAEAFVASEIERIEAGLQPFDLPTLNELLAEFHDKGWWGYNQKESDAAPSDKTGNGRINPAGISYLYASNRKETAALETRPIISQMVSIAEVVVREEISLFDLTRDVFNDEPADDETKMVRKLLAHYFSKPNYSGDQAYLVTQYISEYVKSVIQTRTGLHFDGICFNSSLDRAGINYVIFDTTEHPKYEIVASSLEKVVDMQGSLESYLPLSDAILSTILNGALW